MDSTTPTGRPGPRTTQALAIYPRDHAAAALAGADLFARMSRSRADRAWEPTQVVVEGGLDALLAKANG
ncbi:hypothetical protein [Microlunatus antarcticus]|uniref:Uncharacterized protein n=1 Tax=Microlunatus antarcticus TaxID=53388 RepID=A0A7W5JSJ0_9ACTN|nr:hypothetical protein [Microlunatus antarcticus]MBB3325542.1 hypothetical protein [Microlunatus antarcticus]